MGKELSSEEKFKGANKPLREMTHRFTDKLSRLRFETHDLCVSCGYEFKEGDTTHSGYGESDQPLYVCDKCSGQLKETAVRNYFMPKPYDIPENNNILWRYMDFTKYVSMLSLKGLYFSRADKFEDIFEGAKGVIENREKWDEHYLNFFREAIKNPPKDYKNVFTDDQVEEEAIKLLNDMEQGGKIQRKKTFINCWHENDQESEAMWRLYSSYMENAIALKSSYTRLYESMDKRTDINIGRVEYIDYSKGFAGVNEAFWKKGKSFEHEREVRAIIVNFHTEEEGIIIPCDLEMLIEKVYVSPKSPPWFRELVMDVNRKYGVNTSVEQSSLSLKPFY